MQFDPLNRREFCIAARRRGRGDAGEAWAVKRERLVTHDPVFAASRKAGSIQRIDLPPGDISGKSICRTQWTSTADASLPSWRRAMSTGSETPAD